MPFEVRKAQRQKAKLRVGVSGPSGSGKTYSALLLAYGLVGDWNKIYLIDTEQGSGELYSHLGPYNVVPFNEPYSPERYVEAISAAEEAGAEVIVIDSVTHEWDGKGGILESNELLAQTKYKGNTWAAWSKSTPRHQKFIEKIVTSPAHVITTARAKTDTVQIDGKVKKVGVKEIQREGFEYELTANFNIDRDTHHATASKDRTGVFIDADPFMITPKTGEIFREWAESGAEPIVEKTHEAPEKKKAVTKKVGPQENGTMPDRIPDEAVDYYLGKIEKLKNTDAATSLWQELDSFKDNENKRKLMGVLTDKGKEISAAA